MKKPLTALAGALALCLLLAGCVRSGPIGELIDLTGDVYPDAERYSTGDFSLPAADVDELVICWRTGRVELVQTEDGVLSASESGPIASEDAALRWLLDGRTLYIQFCAPGARVRARAETKHLRVNLPAGLDLTVNTTSADVLADRLDQRSVSVSAFSGGLLLGSVTAGRVELSTSSGDQRLADIAADTLSMNSTSGSLTVSGSAGIAGEFRCGSTSGSVDLRGVGADLVAVSTASGGVRLELLRCPALSVDTTSGTVKLALPAGGARVEYATSSGSLHTGLPHSVDGGVLYFGSGESRAAVTTTSGDLYIAETAEE